MKILYAIQGTGNGHLSRAMDIIPCLQQHGKVDILVSGTQGDLSIPFQIKYKFRGLSFIFGKSGGVDLWKTCIKSNIHKLVNEIKSLPVENYDLVINDFEPVSAWACYMKNIPCIGLSHQATVLAEGHYTVYLPSYDDKRLIAKLSQFKNISWDVFSKHNRKQFRSMNVSVQPIHNEKFIKSMAQAEGVLCGAGFETPAEALFMKKKLLVIPMKNQYEQQLNAAALKQMGVPVIKNLNDKFDMVIRTWINSTRIVEVFKSMVHHPQELKT